MDAVSAVAVGAGGVSVGGIVQMNYEVLVGGTRQSGADGADSLNADDISTDVLM